MDFPSRLGLFDLLGQSLTEVAATRGQHSHDFIDSFQRLQLPVASRMALLSARLAPAPAARRFQSPRGGGPVRGRRFGGVGGIFLPAGQLALQIGDLLLAIGDLLFGLSGLLPKPLVLFSELVVLSLQLLPVEWAMLGTQPGPCHNVAGAVPEEPIQAISAEAPIAPGATRPGRHGAS
jgi:hypothetical protein